MKASDVSFVHKHVLLWTLMSGAHAPFRRYGQPAPGTSTSTARTWPLPDALDSGFHCVRTHWIRGFMAFRLVQRIRIVMLMVPV